MEILKIKNLFKQYGNVNVLKNVNFSVKKGEFIAIMGPSGSGKSTFLNLIAGLDKIDRGDIFINKTNINKLNENQMAIFRRDNIGFVYQYYNLLPSLTVKENILLPSLLIEKRNFDEYEKIIKSLNLKNQENYLPNDLSGGQQQRVAIARALINNPKILLLDEPTGNLDTKNAKKVMDLLTYYNELGQTIILVTHDINVAKRAKKIVTIKNGKIENEKSNIQNLKKQ